MVFGQLTVALRSGGTMSPLPVSAFRIEHIVTVQPDEGLRIGVEGIPQRFVIHYFNIINIYTLTHFMMIWDFQRRPLDELEFDKEFQRQNSRSTAVQCGG